MLKARVLTALVLAPLFLASVFLTSTPLFAAIIALVVSVAAWEWARLAGLDRLDTQLGFAMVVAVLLATIWSMAHQAEALRVTLSVALAFWIFALFWLARPGAGGNGSALAVFVKLLAGAVVLIAAWRVLLDLHMAERGAEKVLFLFTVVWVADIGAYFVGKRFGQRKLAPTVSPGKTREGALGGLSLVGVWGVLAGFYFGFAWVDALLFGAVAVVAAAVSIVGDLFESLLKRQAQMKDSSRLLPGHGGVLDRIDSVLAAAPVMVAFWVVLGWI